ncbi:MAG: class I tRNA ligase family protein, partial [Propionibacteriaceae bacterium]|nr:class I tRNA ligase family protein [Propionibacteriaceae bacterium]
GLLFRLEPHEHSYPFCWRCHTPLMYYAVPSWYIRTTERADALLASNEATNWYPDTIKWGRYGDWLRNNIDWALSRTRFWGTPLPIWRNDSDPTHIVCIGSRAELAKLAGDPSVATMDPHRPFVDDVTFKLPGEPGVYRRVPEVIDAWFDSGSMPFAQWGYPWVEGSKEKFDEHFPADFICEATDQTRGWFYTLMAVSTLVFGQNSYRNVVCLGHILAEDGRKMSKHLGNILLPIPLLDKHGADAVRWFMACAGSPWAARRVGDNTIQEVVRKVLLTYWNTVAFQALYARANNWTPWHEVPPPVEQRHVLDRWLVSRTNRLVVEVTGCLDNFDTQHAGAALAGFVDDLSNWYVRRSRRRFWAGDPNALWTLHETLDVVTRLMAPLTPFVTERVWQDLFVSTDSGAPASVHLSAWPATDEALVDAGLEASMDLTRRLVELGRAARAEAKMKTRQPLARVLISAAADARLNDELRAEILAELNVGQVSTFASAGDVVDYSVKANFRALGKRFGGDTQLVASALAEDDPTRVARELSTTGHVTVMLPRQVIELGPDEVIVTERPREGWSVLADGGETVALDLTLTPDLVQAGLAREVIRLVQDARKASGFDVSDRIALVWQCEETEAGQATAEAIRARQSEIAEEVLATKMDEAVEASPKFEDETLGLRFTLTKR